jgi:hypothetical protein
VHPVARGVRVPISWRRFTSCFRGLRRIALSLLSRLSPRAERSEFISSLDGGRSRPEAGVVAEPTQTTSWPLKGP